jgi:lipopolysaccharide export system permease protein
VRADIAATLVREGAFTEPSGGLTVYSRSIDRGGLIHDLFIHQTKQGGGDTTYSAREGRVATRNGAPVLIMQNGSTQEFSARTACSTSCASTSTCSTSRPSCSATS